MDWGVKVSENRCLASVCQSQKVQYMMMDFFEYVNMFENYFLVKQVSLVPISFCPGIKQPVLCSDKTTIDSNVCRKGGGNYLDASHASSLTRASLGRFNIYNTCTSSPRIC